VNVCYILKSFPRLSQTFVLDELLEQERQGINLRVVALKGAPAELSLGRYAELRAPVHYLPDLWAVHGSSVRGLLEASVEEQAAMLGPVLRAWGIEHIHAHFATWAAGFATQAAKHAGIPASFTAHARDIFHQEVQPATLAARVSQAQFVITVSDYNKRYLENLLASHGQRGRVIRLYNGVDIQQLTPGGSARQPDLVVGVGRLVKKKGFTYLIEALRILHERGRAVRCAIIGDGEERTALAEQVARSGLAQHVRFLGSRSRSDVIHLLQLATVFALPCVVDADGDRDGLPTVLLESMALGTPVISTRVVGIPEMIDDGRSGLLVPERDPVALAEALVSVLDSAPLQQQLRTAALERVQRDFNLALNAGALGAHFRGEDRLAA